VGNLKLEAQTARVAVSVEGTKGSLISLGFSQSKVESPVPRSATGIGLRRGREGKQSSGNKGTWRRVEPATP
jgi:hypothetical protein